MDIGVKDTTYTQHTPIWINKENYFPMKNVLKNLNNMILKIIFIQPKLKKHTLNILLYLQLNQNDNTNSYTFITS